MFCVAIGLKVTVGVTFVTADALIAVDDRKMHAASKTDRPRFSFFIPCFPPLTFEKKYFSVLYIILANVNLEIRFDSK